MKRLHPAGTGGGLGASPILGRTKQLRSFASRAFAFSLFLRLKDAAQEAERHETARESCDSRRQRPDSGSNPRRGAKSQKSESDPKAVVAGARRVFGDFIAVGSKRVDSSMFSKKNLTDRTTIKATRVLFWDFLFLWLF